MAMSADEILKIKSNPELVAEYRQGYLDGFYAVIQSLEMIGNLDKARITAILEKHWYGPLQAWAGGDPRSTLPPSCFTECVYCGNPADEIDHIHPRSKGGKNDIENLAPSCHCCNMSKRDKSVDEWKHGH